MDLSSFWSGIELVALLITFLVVIVSFISFNWYYHSPQNINKFHDALCKSLESKNISYLVVSMLRFPNELLTSFMGPDVGLTGSPHSSGGKKRKIFGSYMAYLWLCYLSIAIFAVIAFPPTEPINRNSNTLIVAIGFMSFVLVNASGDAVSLLFTKKHLEVILSDKEPKPGKIAFYLCVDLCYATSILCIVQTLTNGLYSIQIGHPENFFSYMLDFSIAFKTYGPKENGVHLFEFPGQILISASSFIPTYIAIFTAMSLYVLDFIFKPLKSLLAFVVKQGIKISDRNAYYSGVNMIHLATIFMAGKPIVCDHLMLIKCVT